MSWEDAFYLFSSASMCRWGGDDPLVDSVFLLAKSHLVSLSYGPDDPRAQP